MARSPRLILLAAAITLAPLLASCGTSGGDAFEREPAEKERTPLEQYMFDTMTGFYADLGLEQEQAECLADAQVEQFGGGQGPIDPSQIDPADLMDAVNQCDIPASDLGSLGVTEDGEMDSDAVRDALANALSNMGFTDEQVDCIADAFAKKFGDDMTAMQDLNEIQKLYTDCGIDFGGGSFPS